MDSKVLLVFLGLFSLSFCAFSGRNRNVKGLYCKDPDTNVLHTINSTWPSSTFCGNYTCKMRKTNKNLTNVETNINTFDNKKLTTSQLKQSEYTNAQEKRNMKNNPKELYHDNKPKIKPADRFLTRNEILEIAEILQNVKISDLEALLELYSVAKEVYNEIDNKDDNTKKSSRLNELFEKSQRNLQKSESTYWYDPHYNHKKMKALDLKTDESNAYNVQKNLNQDAPLYYFNGGLSSTDFGKLPYYYPLSAFQRLSSYIHDPKARQHVNNNLVQPLPTVAPIIYTPPPLPNYNTVPKAYVPVSPCKNHYYNHPNNQGIPHTAIRENPAKESTISNLDRSSNLLPFPFTNMQRENESKLQMPFFRINPWMEFLPTKHHLNPTQASQPVSKPIGFGHLPANVPTFINPEIEESSGEPMEEVAPIKKAIHTQSIEENVIPRSRTNQKVVYPEWKTEDLPKEVIEEIRANVLDKSNLLLTPFPLKKSKIKLENLGKLLKLEKTSRKKREVNESFDEFNNKDTENVYEAYIEKTVCKADYSIGYFSVGNSSQPYPRCCPQRIEPTTTTTETSKAP